MQEKLSQQAEVMKEETQKSLKELQENTNKQVKELSKTIQDLNTEVPPSPCSSRLHLATRSQVERPRYADLICDYHHSSGNLPGSRQ